MVLIDGSCTKLLAMTPPPCGFQKHTLKTLLLFIHLPAAVAKKKGQVACYKGEPVSGARTGESRGKRRSRECLHDRQSYRAGDTILRGRHHTGPL